MCPPPQDLSGALQEFKSAAARASQLTSLFLMPSSGAAPEQYGALAGLRALQALCVGTQGDARAAREELPHVSIIRPVGCCITSFWAWEHEESSVCRGAAQPGQLMSQGSATMAFRKLQLS